MVLLLSLLPGLQACGWGGAIGQVNGVSFEMAVDRATVPGGTPYAISIEAVGGTLSKLSVDGVPFGHVETGDSVKVDVDGVVWINSVPRAPKR